MADDELVLADLSPASPAPAMQQALQASNTNVPTTKAQTGHLHEAPADALCAVPDQPTHGNGHVESDGPHADGSGEGWSGDLDVDIDLALGTEAEGLLTDQPSNAGAASLPLQGTDAEVHEYTACADVGRDFSKSSSPANEPELYQQPAKSGGEEGVVEAALSIETAARSSLAGAVGNSAEQAVEQGRLALMQTQGRQSEQRQVANEGKLTHSLQAGCMQQDVTVPLHHCWAALLNRMLSADEQAWVSMLRVLDTNRDDMPSLLLNLEATELVAAAHRLLGA